MVLGCAVLIAWPGDTDDGTSRTVAGGLALIVASAIWVWLRIYNDRYRLLVVLMMTWFGFTLLLGVGSDAVQRMVVNATGEVHQAEVVRVAEEHVKGSISLTYTLTHIDGSPVWCAPPGWSSSPCRP